MYIFATVLLMMILKPGFMSKKHLLSVLLLVCIAVAHHVACAQKCIDLGVGISINNEEAALINFFKNGGAWEPVDSAGHPWYKVNDLDHFKVVNGSYWHWDADWSGTVNNDAWGNDWADSYISYWDMMMDQGKVTSTGYPKQFPLSVNKYKAKSIDPQQGIDAANEVPIERISRRIYFPDNLPASGWVLRWKGKGRISYQGIEVTSANVLYTNNGDSWTPNGTYAGRDYVFSSTNGGRVVANHYWMVHGWVLNILESDPADPIRDIEYLYPGLEASYDAGQRFNPLFVDRMKQFKSLRYMGYLNSNGITCRTLLPDNHPFWNNMLEWMRWDEHTADSWYMTNNGNGGNYENIIALSNLTKTNPWINVPYCAGPAYADSLIRFFLDRLDPDLTLYIEVGNEMWNFGADFNGFFWQANKRVTEYPGLGDVEARGAHINVIFGSITAAAGAWNLPRIKRVYAGFPRYTDVNNRTINYIDPANWDALATTWYFGLTQEAGGNGCVDQATGTNWRSTLYNWWNANQNDQAGFNTMYRNCLLNEFRCTGGFANNSDVVLSKYYNKEIICYEGGNHTFYGCTNGPTGGALNGELNFNTPAYPDFITDNGFINAVATADQSVEMGQVYSEIIDSLQSAGISLANHLSFSGRSSCYGVWSFIQPKDLQEPIATLLQRYPKFKVFSDRIKSGNCDQLNIILPADSVGAGLSIMLDGLNDYVEGQTTFIPTDASSYTVEAWVNTGYVDKDQTILSFSNTGTNDNSNQLLVRNDAKLVWQISNGATVAAKLVGSTLTANKWYHVALSKNGQRYTLYVNGTNVASNNFSIASTSRNTFTIGAVNKSGVVSGYFNGQIDEVRLWETARTQDDIREYMCKKVSSSYSGFTNLHGYYRFDIPDYTTANVFDYATRTSTGKLHNITITERSRYAVSGAALGDYSRYRYTSSWAGVSLSLTSPLGDVVAVSNIGTGAPDGVQLYIIDGKPHFNDAPQYYDTISNKRVAGVFMANGSDPNYDLTYAYSGNPDANLGGAPDNNRLLRRLNYSDDKWLHSGAKLDIVSQAFTLACKEKYRGEYTLGFRTTPSVTRPGSGMALRNNQQPTGEIEGKILYLDITDYTVSFWAKGWGEVFNFTDKWGLNEQKITINPAWQEGTSCQMRFSPPDGQTQYVSTATYTAATTEWKHYAVTRKGSRVTIYINGIVAGYKDLVGSFPIRELRLMNDPGWQTGNYPGGVADLTLDEFTVWNTPLDQTTIRDWMCKKITKDHPYECKNLVLYFNFDEGTGSVLEDKHGPSDMVCTAGFQWVASGAAVGDESMYDYDSPQDITMTHPDGDSIAATRTSGVSNGIHLYRVDNMAPVTSLVSNTSIVSMDSSRYWGMYVVDQYNAVNAYSLVYNYERNSQVNMARESELRFLSRTDNATSPWQANLSITPNVANNTLTLTNQDRGEYILGGTSTSTFNPYVPPVAPVFSAETSSLNKKTICGNSTGLVYKVNRDQMADSYIWTIPAGLDGYSTADSIVLNASYTGTTSTTVTVSVVAVNAYGQSLPTTYTISLMPQPTRADAGPDQTIVPPTNASTMDGNTPLVSETASWTHVAGTASFANAANPKTQVSNIPVGIQYFVWSISNGTCPVSEDTMKIIAAPAPADVTLSNNDLLPIVVCEGDTLRLKVVPAEDIIPDSYKWTLPAGMTLVSQSGTDAVVAVSSGIGGTILVAAVYSGVASVNYESAAISINALPAKPVFVNNPTTLCLNVDITAQVQYDPTVDSVVWTLPTGVYPTQFPKSTSETIEIQALNQVTGYIKAQTFNDGCTNKNAVDSFAFNVGIAPDKPILYLGTDGGTADEECASHNALLWVNNVQPGVTYEWKWNTDISLVNYFNDNKSGALFAMPEGNSNIYVRSVTTAAGCNTSEWYDYYGWAWNQQPSTITLVQITSPSGQAANSLQVGNTYTVSVQGTGTNYYWNLPEGMMLVDDGNLYDNTNKVTVTATSAGYLDVYPITLKGCAGDDAILNVSTTGALMPPTFISGQTTICQGTTMNITVSTIPDATQYVWTLPNGNIYTTTTPILQQTINTAMKGTLSVTAKNASYESVPLEIDFFVEASTLQQTGFVDENNNPLSVIEICDGDSWKAVYHKNANASQMIWNIKGTAIQFEPRNQPGHEGDVDYELINRTSPVDTMMPVSWVDWRCTKDGTDGGYIIVMAVNGCGGANVTDSIRYYWARPLPVLVPEFQVAPTKLCVGSSVNYEIKPIAGAEQYIWKLPNGLTTTQSTTTIPSITVDVVNGTGGMVTVFATGPACGGGHTQVQMSDSVSIHGQPIDLHFVDAPLAACEGDTITFTVNDVGASSYLWSLPGGIRSTVIDNEDNQAVRTGSWTLDQRNNMVNGQYRRATNNNATNRISYTPELPNAGKYKVSISYFVQWDTYSNVPVTINYNGGSITQYVNMQNQPTDGIWYSLGEYDFAAGNTGNVSIGTIAGGNGISIADAVKFEAIGVPGANTMSFVVKGDEGGAVCVTVDDPQCPDGYTVCSDPINLTGDMGTPVFEAKTDTVCEDLTYTFRINDIGADEYTWNIPLGMDINGQSGIIKGLGREVQVTMNSNIGNGNVITVFGTLHSCNTMSDTISTGKIIFAYGICKLQTPVFTSIIDTLCLDETGVVSINAVQNAVSYKWFLPPGLRQSSTLLAGAIITIQPTITVEPDSSRTGNTGLIAVIAQSNIISNSDTSRVADSVFIKNCQITTASFTANKTSICFGDSIQLTNTSRNASNYRWNFGTDAVPASSTSTTPSYVSYTSPGTKTITLEILDNNSNVIDSHTQEILVTQVQKPVITGLDVSCAGITQPYSIVLANGSSVSWSVAGGNINPPTNTSSIDVTWGNTSTAGTLVATIIDNSTSCKASSDTLNIAITPAPTATITGSGSLTNGSANVSLAFTGTPPWSVVVNNGVTDSTVSNINTNPYTYEVHTAGTYTITSISDASCGGGSGSGTAIITATNTPTAILSGGDTVCANTSVTFQVELTGTAPWTIVLSDGVNQDTMSAIQVSPFTFDVDSTGEYTLVSVTDATMQAGIVSGSAFVRLASKPSITVDAPSDVCAGNTSNVTITCTGIIPWNMNFDGTQISATTVSYEINNVSAGTHTITNISDATCTSDTSVSITIDEHQLPTVSIPGNTTVCGISNSNLALEFKGTSPWNITLHTPGGAVTENGITSSSWTYPLTAEGRYTVMSVSDAFCTQTSLSSMFVDAVVTASPVVKDSIIEFGSPVPTLVAQGTQVKWYTDEDMTQLIAQSDTYTPTKITVGVYRYWVTQTLNSCESEPAIATFVIRPNPKLTGPLSVCEGMEYTFSVQQDTSIAYNWSIAGGEITSGEGTNSVTVKITDASFARVTVSQDIIGYSLYNTLTANDYAVNPNPVIQTQATVSSCDSIVVLSVANADTASRYQWISKDGTIVSGSGTGNVTMNYPNAGTHLVNVIQTDTNGCVSDTSAIEVVSRERDSLKFTYPSNVTVGDTIKVSANQDSLIYTIVSTPQDFKVNGNIFETVASDDGQVKLVITATDTVSGCVSVSDTIRIDVAKKDSIDIVGDSIVCLSSDHSYSVNGKSANTRVNWTIERRTDSGNWSMQESLTRDTLIVSFNDITFTRLIVKLLSTSNHLLATDTLIVETKPIPNPVIIGYDTVCKSTDSVLYSVDTTLKGRFTWNATGGIFEKNKVSYTFPVVWDSMGNLVVTVRQVDNYGCEATDTMDVSVMKKAVLYPMNYVSHCFYEEPSLVIVADTGYPAYRFGTGDYSPVKELTVQEPGAYSYSVLQYGCETFDTILVTDVCPPLLVIPEAFTPNGDGNNDVLEVFGHHYFKLKLTIFNNWNEMIYDSEKEGKPWDGTYKGNAVPDGIYPWNAEYKDASNKKSLIKGKVTILR